MKALLVLACACHAAIPPVPGQGGPAWHEVASEHFVVWTDGDVDDARALIQTVEHLRQIELGVSWFNATTNTRAFVIALRRQYEVNAFIPKQFVAEASPPPAGVFQPCIIASIDGFEHDPTAVTHEMTHVISYNALPAQPHWFSEGLATYFETLRIADDGSFALGAPSELRLRWLRKSGPMSADELFGCRGLRCLDAQFYATAWALFSYLENRFPDRLLRYVQRLTEVPANAQSAVFAEVFPELTPGELDRTLATWIKVGDVRIHQYRAKLSTWPATVRTLGDADVLAARGLMRHLHAPRGPVPAEITAAIAAEPTNVLARVVEAARARRADAAVARDVAAAHPDDWRAWWLVMVAAASSHDELPEAARVKMCAAVAKNPAVLPKEMCP
jgi:Protein of unknown function (DUF1570)